MASSSYESDNFDWIPSTSLSEDSSSLPPLSIPVVKPDTSSLTGYRFLKEGYMCVMEKAATSRRASSSSSTLKRAFSMMRRLSDPSTSTRLINWSRRWCVLSDAPDGTHLLLYKDKTSYSSFEAPCQVLPLKDSIKLTSFPAHTKSENTFVLSFYQKDILFYTDTSSELEEWLQVFQETLNMVDSYCHSPLKGLPKQKAERRELLYSLFYNGNSDGSHGDSPSSLENHEEEEVFEMLPTRDPLIMDPEGSHPCSNGGTGGDEDGPIRAASPPVVVRDRNHFNFEVDPI